MKKTLHSLLNRLPYVRGLHRQVTELKKDSVYPPGHFYSPVISIQDIRERQDRIWKQHPTGEIVGIELNTDEQIALASELEVFYRDQPFGEERREGNRYQFKNEYYAHTDALMLHCMIRRFAPKRIIEVGSGFSSAVMLDTNRLFFDGGVSLTFVEPYPDRLNGLLEESDRRSTTLVEKKVQDVELELFEGLEENDILFIDSSHVVKTGSDVNHILFEILPRLKSGVLIHFHDVFHPFEYRKDWVLKGRNWNEDYFLRAYLTYNEKYRILLFADYLHKYHPEVFSNMPLCYKDTGGCLWLRKV